MTKPDPSPPSSAPQEAEAPGFLRALGAVLSSFLGIRRKASGERDMVAIKPAHVILAGLLAAAIFVAVLILVVTMITRQA